MYEEVHAHSVYEQGSGQAVTFAEEGLRAERALENYAGNGCLYHLDNRVRNTGSFQQKHLELVEAVAADTLEPILAETGVSRPMSWELLKKTCWI